MPVQLKTTKNYDLFSYDRTNRPVDIAKHRKLYRSMEKYGYIKSYPMTVRKENGGLVIDDGQHRHAIAKKLDKPVYYVVVDEQISIPEINSTSVGWNSQTYVDSYAKRGFRQYQTLLWFQKEYGLPLNICASLLNSGGYGGNTTRLLRDGKFKVTDQHFAQRVAVTINKISKYYKRAKKFGFVGAVVAISRIKDVDIDRLIKSIEKHPHKLLDYTKTEAVLQNLEEVYNFGRQKLYPLAINAKNAMKKHLKK